MREQSKDIVQRLRMTAAEFGDCTEKEAADLIEALEAEVERLKEDAGWMNIIQGNLRSLLKDMVLACGNCNGSGSVWVSLDRADLNEERGSNEPCPKCAIARKALEQ